MKRTKERHVDVDPEIQPTLSEQLIPTDSETSMMTRDPSIGPRSNRALLLFSAFLLVAFICMKSTLSLLLEKSTNGGKGYPFVIQTVTLVAFACQVCFYSWQTTWELGVIGGMRALVGSYKQMGPAVFYSTLVALSTLLQSMSQSYIEASLYIILMQMTMVLVALGDRFILAKVSTATLWGLVLLQAGIVISYTMVARAKSEAEEQASTTNSNEQTAGSDKGPHENHGMRQVIGIALCLTAETCSACGSILQQRFMQEAAPDLLTSIKLCYQHLFGAVVMIITSVLIPSDINKVVENGFFAGWSWLTVVTALCMWLYFLVASSVTAYVSALAGAMAASVVIGAVAIFEVEFMGKSIGIVQVLLMAALFGNTGFYTFLKDKQNQKLIDEKLLDEELRYTSAASTKASKAQLALVRQYTPAKEMKRLGSRRWNSSNSDLVALSMAEMSKQPHASCPNLVAMAGSPDQARARGDSCPDLGTLAEE